MSYKALNNRISAYTNARYETTSNVSIFMLIHSLLDTGLHTLHRDRIDFAWFGRPIRRMPYESRLL